MTKVKIKLLNVTSCCDKSTTQDLNIYSLAPWSNMILYSSILLWCSIIAGTMSINYRVNKQPPRQCDQSFPKHIDTCMDSFTPHIDQYTKIVPRDPFLHHIFVQHVCKNYKKMLLCVHTVLTNCKTMANIETVQNKLGHDWVIQINIMCDIQSNSSKHFKSQLNSKSHEVLQNSDNKLKLHQNKVNINSISQKLTKSLEKLTKSVLLNKLMHSSDTDVEVITMFVFRSALQTTKQAGSMPNSLNGADMQKLQKLESMQKSHPSNLLEMIISYCTTINKGLNSAKHEFLAQSENFSDRNGSSRHFSWQVVVLITAVNYLNNILR